MEHIFLHSLKKEDMVDCVYYLNIKWTKIEEQLENPEIKNKQISRSGSRYVKLLVSDRSLYVNNNMKYATVFFYYQNISDLDFLRDGCKNRTAYIKVNGRCFSTDPIMLSSNHIIPATEENHIIFDTSNLFPYREDYRNQLLSVEGMQNISLRHTSSQIFQDDYDIISIGDELEYRRLDNSPFDKNQINVFIDGLEETFNIPAYLTPTMAQMIVDGYRFKIIVSNIIEPNEEKGYSAGIRVNIRGIKDGK